MNRLIAAILALTVLQAQASAPNHAWSKIARDQLERERFPPWVIDTCITYAEGIDAQRIGFDRANLAVACAHQYPSSPINQ